MSALKPNFTRLLDMHRDFADIEKFFRSLRRAELTETKDTEKDKWVVTQQNLEGKTYELYGSIDGWCEFFRSLAKIYMPSYDDKPLTKLISKLRLDQEITVQMIDEAEAVLKPQRHLYMSVPARVYNETRLKVFAEQEKV
jgi:hypothetical protein